MSLSDVAVTHVPKESLAVVLIDMQGDFLKKLDCGVLHKFLEEQKRVIRICAAKNILLVVVEWKGFGKTIGLLDGEIQKVPNVITIEKPRSDAFLKTDLHEVLTGYGIQALLVAGIDACVCVFDTAKSAIRLGYAVIVSENLVASDFSKGSGRWGFVSSWYQENCLWQEHLDLIDRI